MNPNEEQSCFWSSGNNEDISLPDGSKSYYDSFASRAEVQKGSLPLIRLVGDNQTSHQLYSPSELLIGQSFTCLTHPVDDQCPPISQFQESSYILPAHSFNGQSWDLNHMPQRRLQDIENSEANFSFSQWPYFNDVHPQQIDNFSYPAQSLENNFSSPQQQEEIHLPPLQLPEVTVPPCCYFQSSSSEKDSFPHALQVSDHSYELFPESENDFQLIWKLPTNTVDHSSNCRKRLPCFINITNKAQVDSPTVSSQARSPVHWTVSDVNLAKNHGQLIDSPTINTKAGYAMCLSDSDVNEASKMPIKIFSGFNVTNQVQVDSPMFSEAGSPKHLTASDVNLAKNIEKLIDFLTKTTKAGSPIPLTDQNVNQTKNLQLIDPPMMTSQAGSPIPLTDPNDNQTKNHQLIDPPMMTSQAGSPIRFIDPPTMTSQAGSPARFIVPPTMTSQASSVRFIDPPTMTSQADAPVRFIVPPTMTSQASSVRFIDPPTMTSQADAPVRFIVPPTMTSQAGSLVRFIVPPMMTSPAGSPVCFMVPPMMTSQAGSVRFIDPPTMTSQAGSPVRFIVPPMMTSQASSVRFIDPPTMTSQAGAPKCLSNSDINQATNLQQQIPLKSILYKTELCRKFLEGHCELGITCQFAHGRNDLRSVAGHPMYKTRVCINFLKFGYCRYADRCIFIHSANPTSSQPYNLGSDGETSPRSSYSSSPPYRKPIDLGAFVVKKGY